jgi:hypothetical protein
MKFLLLLPLLLACEPFVDLPDPVDTCLGACFRNKSLRSYWWEADPNRLICACRDGQSYIVREGKIEKIQKAK